MGILTSRVGMGPEMRLSWVGRFAENRRNNAVDHPWMNAAKTTALALGPGSFYYGAMVGYDRLYLEHFNPTTVVVFEDVRPLAVALVVLSALLVASFKIAARLAVAKSDGIVNKWIKNELQFTSEIRTRLGTMEFMARDAAKVTYKHLRDANTIIENLIGKDGNGGKINTAERNGVDCADYKNKAERLKKALALISALKNILPVYDEIKRLLEKADIKYKTDYHLTYFNLEQEILGNLSKDQRKRIRKKSLHDAKALEELKKKIEKAKEEWEKIFQTNRDDDGNVISVVVNNINELKDSIRDFETILSEAQAADKSLEDKIKTARPVNRAGGGVGGAKVPPLPKMISEADHLRLLEEAKAKAKAGLVPQDDLKAKEEERKASFEAKEKAEKDRDSARGKIVEKDAEIAGKNRKIASLEAELAARAVAGAPASASAIDDLIAALTILSTSAGGEYIARINSNRNDEANLLGVLDEIKRNGIVADNIVDKVVAEITGV